MAEWQTRSSEVVYETPWIKVHGDDVLNQHGDPLTYSYVELQNPSAYTVAVNDEQKILIQSAYRYTLSRRIWEIPAGYVEPGEEPLAGAQRELLEETGREFKSLADIEAMIQDGELIDGPVIAILYMAKLAGTTKE